MTADEALAAALARVERAIERIEASEPSCEFGIALLAVLATEPGAPAHWRDLAAEVAAGRARWPEVWQHPDDHRPAGPELMTAVLRRLAADLRPG